MKKYIAPIVTSVLAIFIFLFIVYLGRTDAEKYFALAVICMFAEAIVVVMFLQSLFRALDKKQPLTETDGFADYDAFSIRLRTKNSITLSEDILENLRYIIGKAADEGRTTAKFKCVKGADINPVKAYLAMRGYKVKVDPKNKEILIIWD